jgi:hypothetical protein
MSGDKLIPEIHNIGCITSRQKDVIEKQPLSQQIKKLFEIMSHKSQLHVDMFISCLPEAARLRVLSLTDDAAAGNAIILLCSVLQC